MLRSGVVLCFLFDLIFEILHCVQDDKVWCLEIFAW